MSGATRVAYSTPTELAALQGSGFERERLGEGRKETDTPS